MSWMPGWDSIAGTHWWSNFYFAASIVSLIALGVTEVISHRYSEREGELAAIEQEKTKLSHESEIARLHVEASQLATDAENARRDISIANREAEKAKAEQERLKQTVQWRTLTPEQISTLSIELRNTEGSVSIAYLSGDPETQMLSFNIWRAFEKINNESSSIKWSGFLETRVYNDKLIFGITIPGPETPQVIAIRRAFFAAGIPFSTSDVPEPSSPISIGLGLSYTPPPKRDALIMVGLRAPPL